jgi:putative membrane protein
MTKVLVRWLLLAGALLLVAHLYPGVVVKSFTSPVTVLSLGLFLFVINALMFWAAASVLQGLAVAGFWAALIGSLIYSLCGMVIDVVIERLFPGE